MAIVTEMGRKGTHPFTSWNGELLGTLPMVSGTGEAPSGIVAYESIGFPEDYIGTLCWSEAGATTVSTNSLLKPRGASFESMPQPIIKGGENFSPRWPRCDPLRTDRCMRNGLGVEGI